MSRQNLQHAKSWGTLPRLYDPQEVERCSTPGPGEYKVNAPCIGAEYGSDSLARGERLKRFVPRYRSTPIKRIKEPVSQFVKARALVLGNRLAQGSKANGSQCVKTDTQADSPPSAPYVGDSRCEVDGRPRSSFGVGRDSVDPWGRDTVLSTPGPGAYRARPSGTFEELERSFDNQSEYTETMYLRAVRRRLGRIEEMRLKKEANQLNFAEKLVFAQEFNPKTLRRLNSRKLRLEEEISSIVREREEQMRPRTSAVLPKNGRFSRGLSSTSRIVNAKQNGRPSSCTLAGFSHFESTTTGKTKQVGGLLSSYSFGGESSFVPLPKGEITGAGVMPVSAASSRLSAHPIASTAAKARPGNPFFKALKSCRSTPIIKSNATIYDTPEDQVPHDTEHDEVDDKLHPTPCHEEFPPRRLRPPSFWPSQTSYEQHRQHQPLQERNKTSHSIRFEDDEEPGLL